MKKLTAIALALIIALTISTACAFDYYTKTAIVTAWERIGDTALWVITVTDEDGNVWDFFDDEETYNVLDLVALRMIDHAEEHEESDEVDDVMLIERLEWHEALEWVNNHGLEWGE